MQVVNNDYYMIVYNQILWLYIIKYSKVSMIDFLIFIFYVIFPRSKKRDKIILLLILEQLPLLD